MKRAAVLALCLLGLALGACGKENDESIQGVGTPGEAFREGLAEKMNGLTYNVFITRQLNTKIPPDEAFYRGPDPGRRETLYGVFVQVCNESKQDENRPVRAVAPDRFIIKDAQENEFRPLPLPKDNAFAYKARTVNPQECIPLAGSVAQQNSAAGALLVYKIPIENLENRPLELEIEGKFDRERGQRDKLRYELDF
jgi:hypothetical protein